MFLWNKAPEKRMKSLIGIGACSILLNRGVVLFGESNTAAHLYDLLHGASLGLLAFAIVAITITAFQIHRQKEREDG